MLDKILAAAVFWKRKRFLSFKLTDDRRYIPFQLNVECLDYSFINAIPSKRKQGSINFRNIIFCYSKHFFDKFWTELSSKDQFSFLLWHQHYHFFYDFYFAIEQKIFMKTETFFCCEKTELRFEFFDTCSQLHSEFFDTCSQLAIWQIIFQRTFIINFYVGPYELQFVHTRI